MRYAELVSMYFERSNALQNYWTLYVVVIGGLIAVASIRHEPDVVAGVLATILFCAFAYKNLDAIKDTTLNRNAVLESIKRYPEPSGADFAAARAALEPTLNPPKFEDVRNFHWFCDGMTVVTMWAMQARRWYRAYHPRSNGGKA